MKKSVLMLLLLLVGVVRSTAAGVEMLSDTTNVYVVDGKECPQFTGKELVGKTVKAYRILYAAKGNKVISMHQISTVDGAEPNIKSTSTEGLKPVQLTGKTVYVLDGKEVEPEVFKGTASKDVKHVTVFGAGGKNTIRKFGERGKDHTFILMETKK